ncbi:alpha/beta fold hydrolase [Nocardia higoensis]|uniref:alpha/beta fold hydrolase n=1 Tax=Nocardia higoensis TaxID=228599 RepID=UPI0002E207EE|nr:alpha/beta fold hydrolase [Nocardia higoensis]
MDNTIRRRSAEIVTLRTSDGWDLDALLYPASDPAGADTVLLHLHGKGATMLDIHARWLPDQLPGVAHFALNMRCHALAYNTDRDDVPVAGGMYESLTDGEVDIAAAVEFLRAEGYRKIIMSGHSSGGYYAGVYTPEGEDIVGRIVLSPLTDNKVALGWWYPGEGELDSVLARARDLVEAGRPDELIPIDQWYWAISARSLLERAAQPDSEFWLERVNAQTSPVLMGWGATESRDGLWSGIYERLTMPKFNARMVDSDHWYHGFEEQVTELVRKFVVEVAGVDPAHH